MIEMVKFVITAWKTILKLVKLQSFVEKCCKMWKIQAWEIYEFCILLYYARKIDTIFSKVVSIFRA